MIDEFLTDGYQRINKIRQDHLAGLGLDLDNQTVLELGAGIGDHTDFWLRRSCQVTAVEGRPENAFRLRSRFPTVEVIEHDLETSLPLTPYQVVYAYGILYHLQNPMKALERWASCCIRLLLLESVVSRDSISIVKSESSDNPTACLHGSCVWLTRLEIVSALSRCLPYVYTPIESPHHEEFPQDWSKLPNDGLVRAIFIGSQKPLTLDTLQVKLGCSV